MSNETFPVNHHEENTLHVEASERAKEFPFIEVLRQLYERVNQSPTSFEMGGREYEVNDWKTNFVAGIQAQRRVLEDMQKELVHG